MEKSYLTLSGKDLGVLTGDGMLSGGKEQVTLEGIFLYRSPNSLVPFKGMSKTKLEACIPSEPYYVTIPYEAIRIVEVNKNIVWRNRDVFDLNSMGIDKYNQVYWGRGDIAVEFRDDIEEVDILVSKILEGAIGLQKTS